MIINQVIISFIASDSADGEIILLIYYYHITIKPGAIIGIEEKKRVDIILIKDVNRSFQISCIQHEHFQSDGFKNFTNPLGLQKLKETKA